MISIFEAGDSVMCRYTHMIGKVMTWDDEGYYEIKWDDGTTTWAARTVLVTYTPSKASQAEVNE